MQIFTVIPVGEQITSTIPDLLLKSAELAQLIHRWQSATRKLGGYDNGDRVHQQALYTMSKWRAHAHQKCTHPKTLVWKALIQSAFLRQRSSGKLSFEDYSSDEHILVIRVALLRQVCRQLSISVRYVLRSVLPEPPDNEGNQCKEENDEQYNGSNRPDEAPAFRSLLTDCRRCHVQQRSCRRRRDGWIWTVEIRGRAVATVACTETGRGAAGGWGRLRMKRATSIVPL